MTQHYFCTLFDSGYLIKGLAMLRSLHKHCPQAYVYVLCMDEQTQYILERLELPFVSCIPLSDVENEALLEAKANRSIAEYCWTLSPSLPWYVMQLHPEIDFITYLDADLLFYSDVQPLFDEIADASIAIIEHRFSERHKHLEINGRFCVEWVSFRRDEEGMACLDRWRRQCIDWCYYRLEDGKMGDQKYLDEWPQRFKKVHVLEHLGAGVAPWNFEQYEIGRDNNGRIRIDDMLLIFYHFHQFQILNGRHYFYMSANYTVDKPAPLTIYKAYESVLENALKEVRTIIPDFNRGIQPYYSVFAREMVKRIVPGTIKNALKKYISLR